MKNIKILALGAALMAAPALMASPAQAGSGFGFGIHKPGFSFYIGERDHWRGRHWRHRHHWRGRWHRREARRYHRWKRICHRRWGRGWDYRRCMDRHGY